LLENQHLKTEILTLLPQSS